MPADAKEKRKNFTSLPDDEFSIWLDCRKYTLFIYFIQNLLIGIDSSFIFMTLWIYLKNDVNTDQPYLFYGVIMLVFYLPPVISANFLSRYVDRTREIRTTCLAINMITIVGNLLWIVPYSPWYLVVSRFLSGCANTTRSIMSGEVARSVLLEDLSKKMSFLGMAFTSGYLIGQACAFMFKNVEFHIGNIKITFANFPGVLMAILFLVQQIFIFFKLANLSKMYDLKADRQKMERRNDELTTEYNETHSLINDKNENLSKNEEFSKEEYSKSSSQLKEMELSPKSNKEDNFQIKRKSLRDMYKVLLTSPDVIFLLFATSIQNYLQTCFYMWVPLLVEERLHWSIDALGVINISVGVFTVFPMLILFRCQLNNHRLLYIGLISQLASIIGQVLLTIQYYVDNKPVNVTFWVIYCISWVFLAVSDEVFISTILAQMTSSEHQIFVDSLRLMFYRIGILLLSCLHPWNFTRC